MKMNHFCFKVIHQGSVLAHIWIASNLHLRMNSDDYKNELILTFFLDDLDFSTAPCRVNTVTS